MNRAIAARSILLCALPLLAASPSSALQSPPARIDPGGIRGALVVVGGGRIPEEVSSAFRRLAGEEARLVVIPTASASADEPGDEQEWIDLWQGRGFDRVVVLHTRDRAVADDPAFSAPLEDATAVWFGGGDQSRISEAYLGTGVERAVTDVLGRGGVVGGTSAGAAIQSRLMITGGNPEATTGEGFDLLPDAVIDQHFVARDRMPRLQGVLRANPGKFGVGVDESTALVVRGRDLTVVGESTVTLLLPASGSRPEEETVLRAGDAADLTALRRAARDRAGEEFPPQTMGPPRVEGGSLVIVGGGGLPDEVVRRFVALAGGAEARIVIVPTAAEGRIPEDSGRVPGVGMFEEQGVRSVGVLYGRDPGEVETPEQVAMLRRATGVWFGGGRQWRFVDAYEGTGVVELFRDVLRRGGVIGGSSAGATIQGEYLVRGNPLGNADMMADGYERGFAFLPGVAIDQHFAQRDRFGDLSAVVDRFPQVLGIGIDEGTALVVRGSVGEVVGGGNVHVFDGSRAHAPGGRDFETIGPGGRFDLARRVRVDPGEAAGGP
ncbi:cyanophycinase [Tautonia plasticadhaerens]|uniref:Cyanophycinase n=1 Tax=Tautonia plasticadhaerens TaxID=2527974 RepID=A0A518GXN3_9BACT|nr:cyanophycinase [Tautonia plasticadhaerens]QDV33356.1 Cyanophycinase [Tautonia plasticadhaerens]